MNKLKLWLDPVSGQENYKVIESYAGWMHLSTMVRTLASLSTVEKLRWVPTSTASLLITLQCAAKRRILSWMRDALHFPSLATANCFERDFFIITFDFKLHPLPRLDGCPKLELVFLQGGHCKELLGGVLVKRIVKIDERTTQESKLCRRRQKYSKGSSFSKITGCTVTLLSSFSKITGCTVTLLKLASFSKVWHSFSKTSFSKM